MAHTWRNAVLAFSAAAVCLHAQHFQAESFGADRGLTNLSVEGIAQDQQGYLWVSTQAGLFRFDGTHFSPAGTQLGLSWFWSQGLHVTRDGTLWVGTMRGLVSGRNGNFRFEPIAGVNQVDGPQTIASDASGRLFVATDAGLMLRTSNGQAARWTRLWPAPNAASERAPSVYVDTTGRVWFGCGSAICQWDGQRTSVYGAAQGVAEARWFSFATDGTGRLWARSPEHLLEWDTVQTRWSSKETATGAAATAKPGAERLWRSTAMGALFVDREGQLLIPTDYGLARRTAQGWRYTRRHDGLPVDVVKTMYEDREGNTWVGTYGGGLARWIGHGDWLSWTETEGLVAEDIWAIQMDGTGRYWVATGRGLNRVERRAGEWSVEPASAHPRTDRVLALARDRDGHVWAPSHEPGIERVDNGQRIAAPAPIKSDNVFAALVDGDNRLWAATNAGLWRSTPLHAGAVRFAPVETPRGGATVWWSLALGPDGSVWAAGKQGLLRHRGGAVHLYGPKDGLLSEETYQVLALDHEVWLAYEYRSGLTRLSLPDYDDDTARPTAQHFLLSAEFNSDHIFSLAQGRDRKLYAGTGSGLFVYDGHNWERYTAGDGLVWSDCSSNALLVAADGALWIGTSRGLSRYQAASNSHRLADPGVFITAARHAGHELSLAQTPKLTYGTNTLEFVFAGLSFGNHARVRFRYRLLGLEDDWVETAANTVRYPSLAPGRYQLQVMARSAAGVWSPMPAVYSFEITAPWWRSPWFLVLCGATALLVARAIYLWRVRFLVARERWLSESVTRATRAIEEQKTEIQHLLERSEQANRAKNEFLANVSHELRTPLTGVIGMSDLLGAGDLDPVQRDQLAIIRQSASGLLGILNDILDLSKVETGRMGLESAPFNPRRCAEEAVATLSAPAERKGLTLTLDIAEDVPERVIGDALRLRQVLLNLIGNAVKFTETGSVRVSLRAKQAPDGVYRLDYTIADTGVGIPVSQQQQIFQPFRQVDNSMSRVHGGAGLGLAICYNLIELMRGSMELESAPGVGSTFRFYVHLDPAAPCENTSISESLVPLSSTGPRRILLVEDNAINRMVILGLLRKQGHYLDVAENGRDALDALAQTPYDLVLMDVQMPVMDGIEATRRIRERESESGKHVPVIGLTALAMKGDRELCLSAGMDECLNKPIDLINLMRAIETTALPLEKADDATSAPPQPASPSRV